MKKQRSKIAILFAAVFMSVAFLAQAEVVDKIAIIVNNEIVTQGEIDRAMLPVYEQYKSIYSGDELFKKLEEARQRIVEQIIEDRLIFSEAKKMNIEVDEKAVDAKVKATKSHFENEEQFEAALEQQGASLKSLRERYKEQIMIRKLMDQKIGSKIIISPVEIKTYYDNHKDEFVQPEQVKLRNILIRPSEEKSPEEAAELARAILQRIKEGSDFAGLAAKYSDGPQASEGGLMGYVKKGDLLPEIEAAVFKLNQNETSDIIQTSLGYYIFFVEEKREKCLMELSEVRQEVEEAIFREKVKDRIKDWVANLKKNAYIAFK